MTTTKPEPGDIADHRSRTLDPRPIAEVSEDGKRIRLRIGSFATDWLLASAYTFTKARA